MTAAADPAPEQDLSGILGARFPCTCANGWQYEMYAKNATAIDYRVRAHADERTGRGDRTRGPAEGAGAPRGAPAGPQLGPGGCRGTAPGAGVTRARR
ncbi:hypothetical protein GCM10027174_17070 [Salinifilum aidingensis]